MIDYALMRREAPKLKRALTLAQKSGDIVKVLAAIERAIETWDNVGAWPDDWHRWSVALDDAWYRFVRHDRSHDDQETLEIGEIVHALHDRLH